MTYSYKTHGTCSRRIDFDIDDDNTVHNVHFTGGCNGNLAGISSIVEGTVSYTHLTLPTKRIV